MESMQKLLDFLCELEQRKIFFKLARVRNEAVMVEIAVPGERWEVEFFVDGAVEVETFESTAGVQGEEALVGLFAKYSD